MRPPYGDELVRQDLESIATDPRHGRPDTPQARKAAQAVEEIDALVRADRRSEATRRYRELTAATWDQAIDAIRGCRQLKKGQKLSLFGYPNDMPRQSPSDTPRDSAMRQPRIRFTIRGLMIAIAITAGLLALPGGLREVTAALSLPLLALFSAGTRARQNEHDEDCARQQQRGRDCYQQPIR